MNQGVEVLEKGHIYFFYRPRVEPEQTEEPVVKSPKDIQRLYLVLHPENQKLYRLLLIGHKKLPEIEPRYEKTGPLLIKLRKTEITCSKNWTKEFIPLRQEENVYCLRFDQVVKAFIVSSLINEILTLLTFLNYHMNQAKYRNHYSSNLKQAMLFPSKIQTSRELKRAQPLNFPKT